MVKKIYNIYAILMVALFSSCLGVDIIDRVEKEDGFYKTEEHARYAINGVYSTLTSFQYHKTNWPMMLAAAEDAMFVTGSTPPATISNNTHSANTAPAVNLWFDLYKGINNANEVIARVPAIPFEDEKEKARIIAEAHFLRALFYYDLVRLYGGANGVPLPLKPTIGLEDAYNPQVDKEVVYAQIISDFKYSSGVDADGLTLLPLRSESRYMPNRATNGAAHAFIADVYLTMGEWQNAIDHADIVLGSNQYSFVEDYKDLWDVEMENLAQTEHIFSVAFFNDKDAPMDLSLGSNVAFWFNPDGVAVGGEALCGNPYGKGSNQFKVQKWFVRYFQDDVGQLGYSDPAVDASRDENNLIYKDYRIESSFHRNFQLKNNNTGELGDIVSSYPALGGINRNWGYIKKFIDPKGVNNRTNENDMPRLRLSDMYLIQAEAYNELEDYANACIALDEVRNRARMADGVERAFPKYIGQDKPDNIGRTLTQQEFRWLVFMERGLEFAGEQKRWFDLIRMKWDENTDMYDYMKDTYIPNNVQASDIQNTGVMATRKKYFPIPFGEINNNTELEQNPGY